ncbi:MAG: GNAT family N-acetyltransferase [Proteobacteria bacterium]|nr:GNAT family N-acetyltransferase [Desulfobacula sp.]MBU3953293.1 GNAT family N-acetyltransferase [Pseudomonadota bacterium]MBU4129323.1 GNAT family N-acetyltransferase [Pseudomonadota bacterium]
MTPPLQTEIEIRLIKTASLDALVALYKDAGWWEDTYGESPEFLHHIVGNSALFAGAFLNKKMIGMGRALSDLVSDAYIQDVAVLKEYRGRGIGKKIIQTLITGLKAHGVDWIGLIAEPGTTVFYEDLGFQQLEGHVPLKLKDETNATQK